MDPSTSTPAPTEAAPVSHHKINYDPHMSKLKTGCAEHAKASYKCIEENYAQKSSCSDVFDAYRKCRKLEHSTMIEERRKIYDRGFF